VVDIKSAAHEHQMWTSTATHLQPFPLLDLDYLNNSGHNEFCSLALAHRGGEDYSVPPVRIDGVAKQPSPVTTMRCC